MVKAYWSGKYPCLCFGEWQLKVNNKDVTDKIPIFKEGMLYMKKVLIVMLSLCLIVFMAGCSDSPININVENPSDLNGTTAGRKALIKIEDYLWYDSTTRIVYWWNGNLGTGVYSSTTPSPYYAPNGLPYRYNPETNTFEEIGDT